MNLNKRTWAEEVARERVRYAEDVMLQRVRFERAVNVMAAVFIIAWGGFILAFA